MHHLFAHGTLTLSGGPFQASSAKAVLLLTPLQRCMELPTRRFHVSQPSRHNDCSLSRVGSLGSSPFARHYSGNRFLFLFLRVLRCFSSPGALLRVLPRRCRGFPLDGFPHSETSGSLLACSSPERFVACHVLRRLLAPRHPPCALLCFLPSLPSSPSLPLLVSLSGLSVDAVGSSDLLASCLCASPLFWGADAETGSSSSSDSLL